MAEFSLYSNPMPNFNDPAYAAGLVAFLKQQEPNLLKNLSYVDRIKYENPTAYEKLTKLAKYTADESFGGQMQDYQAQIFSPLSDEIINSNKSIDVTKGVPKGVTPRFESVGLGTGSEGEQISEDRQAGFSKDLGKINGIPVTANYDLKGNLVGFQGDPRVRTWLSGNSAASGSWSASGKPEPKPYTSSSGGGFLGGLTSGFGDLLSGVGDIFGDAKNAIGDLYMEVRDPLEAAAVVAGNYFVPGSSLLTSQLVSDDAKEILATDLGKAAMIGSGLAGSGAFSNSPVGSATGADNIDIGGGWSPAAGATEAELASARAALEGVVATPIPDASIVETVLPPLADSVPVSAPTLDQIIADLGSPPATITTSTADVYGPELLGEAGGNTFPLELEPEGLGPVPLGDAPTVTDITNTITGNADRAALNSNAGYGDTLTSAQITAFDAAVAGGMSVADALNYVRAGLLVNALTGDPLGLSGGGGGGGGTTGSTGFAQVPIPAEWRSPTYATPAAPIDLNSLFTDMNLLGGTQWQGLVNQKPNLSFNDIFASGKQQTPMGTPVNINQIVSNILGQNTAS